MAYFRIDMSSVVLSMATSFIAIIPEEIEVSLITEAPVVFLLHGLSDNCTGWSRYTSAERYARDHKVCLVMPEVQRSFYTDMYQGLRYFTFIREELPRWCADRLNLRGPRYVMGLSMGGYGALKCYLTDMVQFYGCAAFSSVADISWIRQAHPECQIEFSSVFNPKKPIPEECDILALIKKQKKSGNFFISCGTEDSLYPANQILVEALSSSGHQIMYSFRPGIHSWSFWDESLKQAFDYFFPLGEV